MVWGMAATMKILFLDSYYENVVEHLMGLPGAPEPDAERWTKTKWLNEQCHGTADYWERAVKALGHEAATLVLNAPWNNPRDLIAEQYFDEQNRRFEPDVMVYQNVADRSGYYGEPACKHVAFCSYAANDVDLRGWDAVFTSFPHHVDRIRNAGSPCHYLQLAFDPIAVERTKAAQPMIPGFWGDVPTPIQRDLWLTFVGGLGYEHLWKKGTVDIADASSVFRDRFKWWGYGPTVRPSLKDTYQGRAWGKKYYEVLLRSKITLNRHGEIAGLYANNMRLYEATGCGCCLVTNAAVNMARILRPMDECVVYRDHTDLAKQLWILQNDDDYRKEVAAAGQKRCLAEHTYAHRAKEFLTILEKL